MPTVDTDEYDSVVNKQSTLAALRVSRVKIFIATVKFAQSEDDSVNPISLSLKSGKIKKYLGVFPEQPAFGYISYDVDTEMFSYDSYVPPIGGKEFRFLVMGV